jgi:hypothetical protein
VTAAPPPPPWPPRGAAVAGTLIASMPGPEPRSRPQRCPALDEHRLGGSLLVDAAFDDRCVRRSAVCRESRLMSRARHTSTGRSWGPCPTRGPTPLSTPALRGRARLPNPRTDRQLRDPVLGHGELGDHGQHVEQQRGVTRVVHRRAERELIWRPVSSSAIARASGSDRQPVEVGHHQRAPSPSARRRGGRWCRSAG